MGLLGHLSHQDKEFMDACMDEHRKEHGAHDMSIATKPKGWKKVCDKCYYFTGKGGIGKAYKCYCGDCPAKARDDKKRANMLSRKKGKPADIAGRIQIMTDES